MGDITEEERKGAAMKTKNEEIKIMDASVIITVRINGIFGYSEIVFSPSDIGIDKEEILKKLQSSIEQRTAKLEDMQSSFKPMPRKHPHSNTKTESVGA